MVSYQQHYLKEMGIDVWVDRDTPIVDRQHLARQLEPASEMNTSSGMEQLAAGDGAGRDSADTSSDTEQLAAGDGAGRDSADTSSDTGQLAAGDGAGRDSADTSSGMEQLAAGAGRDSADTSSGMEQLAAGDGAGRDSADTSSGMEQLAAGAGRDSADTSSGMEQLAAGDGAGRDSADTSSGMERLAALAKQVAVCQQCGLHKNRTQTVFGTGNPQADWLLIGEAPGAEEDRQGEPFVGRAGKLLNNMLLAMGLSREQVYIANILKCRPPDNRDPEPEEVIACESYLRQQIALIKPKIILTVGRVAAQNLLKLNTPIGKMRGKRYQYPGSELPVFVTYHPAYLLRSPREKRKVWDDLKFAMRTFKEIT